MIARSIVYTVMIYLLLASFLWGTSFIAGKIAYQSCDPALVVLYRLLLAALLMLPVSYSFLRRKPALSKVIWLKIALLGLFTYPITFLLQFMGLHLTSAVSAATIIGMEPIMVMLVGWLFFKQKASPAVIALGLIACIGVALVVGNTDDRAPISLNGCLLVLLSTVVVAFWLRLSQSVLQDLDAKIYTALSVQLGTLLGLPLMAFLVQDWHVTPTWDGIAAILYLGIGCSLLAGWLWNKGLSRIPANLSGIFLALEPVFGVLLAVILLKESLSLTALSGIILVVGCAGVCMLLPKSARS